MIAWKRPTDEELWKLRELAEPMRAIVGTSAQELRDAILSTIPPKPKKIEAWANIYSDGTIGVMPTADLAEMAKLPGCIRTVRLVEAAEGE